MNAKRFLRVPFVSLRGQSFCIRSWFTCVSISAAATLVCLITAGPSLDLFLGTLLLCAILAPSLGRISPIVAGCSLVWLWAVITGPVSITTWIGCTLVLASFTTAIVCARNLLIQRQIHPIAASAIVTFTSLAWLTWPIWFNGSGPVAIHPAFAINAACKNLGIWTEQRIAYRLITLGQDTSYRLPTSILPAFYFHIALAGIFIALNPGYSPRTQQE
jgi:hypothetical protein